MSNLEGILGSAARLIFNCPKLKVFGPSKNLKVDWKVIFKKVLIQKSNLIDIKQIIYQKQIYTNKITKYSTSVALNTCSKIRPPF